MFPALLKFWRGRRGLSQLDFALRAGVSSKHISFLETGRSRPSEEMVMLLAGTLALSPRQRDDLLVAAGFDAYLSDAADPLADSHIRDIVDRMLAQHDPFPMLVLDSGYDVLRMNDGATRLFTAALGQMPARWNAVRLVFEPDGARSILEDWALVAFTLVDRLQREVLLDPHNERLQRLLDEILGMPGVDASWRRPDFSRPATPLIPLRFRVDGEVVSFVTTVTRFSAPQTSALDALQLEAWFPVEPAATPYSP
jgi:transcriptional regulator with XRE-family HTH domain